MVSIIEHLYVRYSRPIGPIRQNHGLVTVCCIEHSSSLLMAWINNGPRPTSQSFSSCFQSHSQPVSGFRSVSFSALTGQRSKNASQMVRAILFYFSQTPMRFSRTFSAHAWNYLKPSIHLVYICSLILIGHPDDTYWTSLCIFSSTTFECI